MALSFYSSFSAEWPPGTIVQELDGLVYVTENTDTARIQQHLHLWAETLQSDVDKLAHLTASMMTTKAILLVKAVNSLQDEPVVPPKIAPPLAPQWWGGAAGGSNEGAERRRFKRNIIGDALHFLTGVATDEELQEQVKKDNDLRDKITATLTRQIAYEKELTNSYATLAREEEGISGKVSQLEEKHRQDISSLRWFQAHQNVVKEDIEKLSDILEAVQTGVCNTRHATYISSRAGLTDILQFRFHNVSSSPSGPVIIYSSRMFRRATVMRTSTSQDVRDVLTPDRMYILHPSHLHTDPITEEETRVTTAQYCEECALILHMGQQIYRTIQPGYLNCTSKGMLNLTKEEGFKLDKGEYCFNPYMAVGLTNIRHTTYKLDIASDTMLDALLLRSHITTNSSIPEGQGDLRKAHDTMVIKMGQDVAQANRDLDNFILETKERDDFHLTAISTTGIWLIVITIFVIILLGLIARTCWANRAQLMRAAEAAAVIV